MTRHLDVRYLIDGVYWRPLTFAELVQLRQSSDPLATIPLRVIDGAWRVWDGRA